MEDQALFIEKVKASYNPKGAYIYLGAGILEGNILADAQVNLALKMVTAFEIKKYILFCFCLSSPSLLLKGQVCY